jgi:type II secretory pathway component GspD/PulD (secretin)
VPPARYVETVVKLCQSGKPAMAAPYLKAAEDYADMLTPDERATIEQYRAIVVGGGAAAPAPVDPTVTPVASPRATPAAPLAMGGRGTERDDKQAARWLLQSAREDVRLGRYDAADEKVNQARAMNVSWTLFDDTPNKVAEVIEKARPKATSVAGAPGVKGDKAQAKELLRQARAALQAGDYEKSEATALEVGAWGLHFGMLEDSPEKVASAARALRRHETTRKAGPKVQPNDELYTMQVDEARRLLAAGKLDDAEMRASQAQSLGVIPPVTSDRAESVLADVAAARARGSAMANTTDGAVVPTQDLAPVGQAIAPAPLDAPEAAPADDPQAPAPVDDPRAPAPVDAEPAPAPVGEPVGGSPLDSAMELYKNGNFPAARKAALDAKTVDPTLASSADDLIAQINLAEQNGVLALYEAALSSLRKGEYGRSRALLNEMSAIELDESMTQKVQDLLTRIPQDEKSGRATIGSVEDVAAVKAQKLNAEVGTKVAEARRLLETDPEKAIALLEQTAVQVKAAGMPESVARTMTRRLEVAIELAKKDKVAFDAKMKDKEFRADIEHKRLRILEADNAKKSRLKELLDKAHQFDESGNYAESEKYYKMAVEVDPNEIAAVAGAQIARYKRHYNRDQEIRSAKEDGVVTALQDVDATMIVSPDLQRNSIDFPKGFAALSASRRAMAERYSSQKTPKQKAIEQKLNEPISLNADKQSLGEAIDYIANFTGLNIVIDPSALAEEGLTLNQPVTLKLNGVKLKQALQYLLGPLHLTYQLDDEVVLITSPDASRLKTFVKTYNVADLVMPPGQHNKAVTSAGPMMMNAGMPMPDGTPGPIAGMSNPGGQNALGAPNPSVAAPTGMAFDGQPQVNIEAPKIDFGPLINLITSTIAPGTWSRDHTPMGMGESAGYGQGAAFGGGGLDGDANPPVGTITPFFLNISLIIRHTAETHDEIVDLLRQLRKLQDLQVSIEVRFVTVSDSFFEQIGVDFDFAVQSDAIGRKSTFAAPVAGAGNLFNGNTTTGGGTTGTTGITNPYVFNPIRDHALGNRQPLVVGTGGQTTNVTNPNFSPNLAIPFVQDSSSAIAPFNAVPNVGGSIGVAFLSDLEVYLFLQAIQGDTRNNLVQAPKVTTFNGANATIINTTTRFYIAQLIPILAAGAVAYQPVPAALPDGVIFNVTPVVSADRRYVRMTLNPFFQTFIEFQTFSFPTGAVGGGGLGGGAATIPNGQINLPVVSVTNILTTVTVPDGGTVLMGGVKRLREQRLEYGVPVLSKTPMINRLFRNIGVGRTTDSLMLMVTPRIIILEEEEEKLGIPAVNTTF